MIVRDIVALAPFNAYIFAFDGTMQPRVQLSSYRRPYAVSIPDFIEK